jgi:uncharacterized protein (UPF0332 family)
MIKDNDRQALIDYRLEQANNTIKLSQFLIDSNQFVVAVNRIYYGMYYALTALALKHRFETSKHAQLIGWFNKEFVKKGIINPEHGRILRDAYSKRLKGDYDVFISFEKEEVLNLHKEMIAFVQKIKGMITDV